MGWLALRNRITQSNNPVVRLFRQVLLRLQPLAQAFVRGIAIRSQRNFWRVVSPMRLP
jgi:hypothetical protein